MIWQPSLLIKLPVKSKYLIEFQLNGDDEYDDDDDDDDGDGDGDDGGVIVGRVWVSRCMWLGVNSWKANLRKVGFLW